MNKLIAIFVSLAAINSPIFAEEVKTENATAEQKIETPVTKISGEIRALVVPKNEATLSASISGKVEKLDVDLGDKVKKGQVLVVFATGSYQAEFHKAKAELDESQKIFNATQRLLKSNAVSEMELTKAEASLHKAKADVELRQYFLNECRVVAPYDCRVTKRHANSHEVVQSGSKLLSIVGDESLRVQILVPSSQVGGLKIGSKFEVSLDETKTSYPVTIKQIGARIDPASQSVEVLADFAKYDPNVVVGMSGAAKL